MYNLLFGLLTVTFCAAGYILSWRCWSKENYNIALLLLIICGLVLRIYTASDFFLNTWDERYHALVAKNLITHPLLPSLYDHPILSYDYKNWTANHIWLHNQPLTLWTIAASLHLFGLHELALRLPSILLTTMGIWLIYLMGCYLFNKKIGYVSAFFYSINGLIIELTAGRVATDHIDIFFMFFIQLAIVFSILFAQKQKTIFNIAAGISIGCAILCKWLPALIVIPIWLLLVIDSKKFSFKQTLLQFFLLLILCRVTFSPWQFYIHTTFPLEASWEASANIKHITTVVEDRTGPFYYYLDRIRINYGELIYIPLIWFVLKSCRIPWDLKRLAITIWFLIPFLFFSIAKTKMQAYILFTAPALFLMTSEFFLMLNEYKKDHKLNWFFNLIMIFIIALPIRYTLERVKPFDIKDRSPQWVIDIKKLNDKKIDKGVLFNYDKPIEAMFYTHLTVYPMIPEKYVIHDLIQKGYTIIINDNGSIPAEIQSMKGIGFEKLK